MCFPVSKVMSLAQPIWIQPNVKEGKHPKHENKDGACCAVAQACGLKQLLSKVKAIWHRVSCPSEVASVFVCLLAGDVLHQQHQQQQLKHWTTNGRGEQTRETLDSTKLSYWSCQSCDQLVVWLIISPNELQAILTPSLHIWILNGEKHDKQAKHSLVEKLVSYHPNS